MERPHRHLHRKGCKEAYPKPCLHLNGEFEGQQGRNIRGLRRPIHRHNGNKHKNRTEQRVEEEFKARINAPLATPNPNDQEHRDKACFEEQIEQDEI